MAALIPDEECLVLLDKNLFLKVKNGATYYPEPVAPSKAERASIGSVLFFDPNHAWCVTETGYQTGKVGPKAPSRRLSLLLGFPHKQVEPGLLWQVPASATTLSKLN